MAKKKSGIELPTWAQSMWKDLGSPKLEDMTSVHNGDLLERRHGLRKDDFIEVHMNVRAFSDPSHAYIRGRLLSSGKTSLEILGDEFLEMDGHWWSCLMIFILFFEIILRLTYPKSQNGVVVHVYNDMCKHV